MNKSVACIAFENKKILIAHRNSSGQMADRWEFPGGKVEDGENETQAVVREMREEFGITVAVLQKITSGHFFHGGKERSLEVYLVKVPHDGIKQKYVLSEHTEYAWVVPEQIPEDNFVDSDLSVCGDVISFLKTMPDGCDL